MLDVEESMLDRGQSTRRELRTAMSDLVTGTGACEHLRDARVNVEANTPGECEDCVREGATWVHLRICVTCGHTACCDSSPGRHASVHHRESRHPVMQSGEPGESWRWCFVDELTG